VPEGLVDGLVLHFLGDLLLPGFLGALVDDGEDGLGDVLDKTLLRPLGVTLLLLAALGEDQQVLLVSVKPLDVEVEGLLVPGLPPVVDLDADGLSFLLGDTLLFELLEGETLTLPQLEVVPLGGAVDLGLEGGGGPGELLGLLLLPLDPPGFLPTLLVEPGLDVPLPPLPEVHVGDNVVVLDSHIAGWF